MISCPINFGDCADCIYYIGGYCEYEEEQPEPSDNMRLRR